MNRDIFEQQYFSSARRNELRAEKDKDPENGIMYSVLLQILCAHYGIFSIMEIIDFYFKNGPNRSHDNTSSGLTLMTKRFFIPWSCLIQYLHPRDICFYLCTIHWIFWPLRIVTSLCMIWSCLPFGEANYLWPYRLWIRLTYKYEWTKQNFKWTQANYSKVLSQSQVTSFLVQEKIDRKVIEIHDLATSGKLLNINRIYRLNMKLTAWICNEICLELYGPNYLNYFMRVYFENDDNHPLVIASEGKTYLTILE